ncbi:MAG: NAD(P)-dependent glycerol-3-phosphate dehydrogenase [Deltaproteobacteria bacterium]|nr:NAD(P)-dependent glycerol-3-phosphate dehydrogenase [Deltaproteobacteria bacterium]
MLKISVLGLGNWGTALANHLASGGNDVLGWCIEEDIAASINSDQRNPRYQSDIKLEKSLKATNDLAEALERKVILMVFPSAALKEMVPKLSLKADTILISAIKGLEKETLLTPLQYAQQNLKTPAKLCVISGPSFAKDVVRHLPCTVVAASDELATAEEVAKLFSFNNLRVYSSTDTIGVELGGVLKNVIALAAGVCDALNLGDSARAALITRGLAEMTRLATAMGADARTLAGLSGLGDLVMTASCDTSRNRTVGLRLGNGESLDHIIETLGSVAEGVTTTPLALRLAEKYQEDLPIAQNVQKLLNGEQTPKQMVEALISRPLRKEFK